MPISALGGKKLSAIDIYEINAAYECPNAPENPLPCPFQDESPEGPEMYDILPPRLKLSPESPCVTVQSPGYPDNNYEQGEWIWQLEVGSAINEKILKFNFISKITALIGRSRYCPYDGDRRDS